MDNRPIGMFDSGVGGMTVFKEITNLLPNENITYIGDTASFPYGSKSKETIIELSKKQVENLIQKDAKLIVIACGTATSQALEEMKKMFNIPIIGIIEPTVKYIKENITDRKFKYIISLILVTMSGLFYQATSAMFQSKACALLASMAEEGWTDNEIARLAIHEYVKDFKDIDSLVLGCTHYPLFKNLIENELPNKIDVINTGEMVSKYLKEYLADDSNFDKLLYKYLIKSGSVTGEQVCAIVYEQGILPMDDSTYNGLLNGKTNAFSWIKSKLENLELTPGELALEPCSAGAVVTNPNTGEVLACVSYPGYDNNRLSNVMDRSYYVKLSMGMSRTFYNRATQEKTAPGSTYKMLSSVAGLTEGVINGNSYISCSGVFDKITPSPKCWIYPSAHGSLNVVGALQHSCNDFFYEVGYRLGQDSNGNYDSDIGLEKLAKYAKMFGFDQTSGIEIPESQPQISDSDSVRSAIGQGTNNYTVSQINRYVTAVANRGTVYSLSLIDKTTDSNGKLIKDYTPEVVNQMDEISSSTWDLVHNGMESMVKSSSTFAGMDISMGGKTGTAQYSKIHADNVLFVGYAPADSPEISIAVRIANGYASTYAAEIGRDITKVYFNPESADELLQGYASSLGTAGAGD